MPVREHKGLKIVFGAARVVLPVLLLLSLAAGASADRMADIRARGKLVVGVSDAIPPFTYRGLGGAAVGYDIDILRGVATRLGVFLETVTVPETERIKALQQGKVDLIASTFTRTPERERQVGFSLDIFSSPQVMIVDKGSGLTSVKALGGRNVGVLKGRTADKNILAVVPTAKIVFIDGYPDAFAGLRAKTLDAFAADNLVLRTNLKKEADADRFLFLPDFRKDRNAGFGIKMGEVMLKFSVDQALFDMEESGEAAKIFDEWFGPKSAVPIERTFKIEFK
jgi:polar amino acid transport system substrate-binding protein